MLRTPLRLALIATATAALLAGCGASGGDDAADSPTTTEAEATTTAPSDTTEPEATETTEAETTETTEAGSSTGGDDICVPLKVLSDFDIESAELINAGDWPSIQAFFEAETDDVLAAYDDAIALDSEVTAELEELRAVTEGTAEAATESSSLMDLSEKLLATPGITEAGQAGLTLNIFAETNCGFSTGGNGQ